MHKLSPPKPEEIRQKTLVFVGNSDCILDPELQKEYFKNVADVELQVIDKGSHDTLITHFDEIYPAIKEFIQR